MKKLKRITIINMLMFLLVVTAGCGNKDTDASDMDTVSFSKDGKIVETIVESFDEAYYDVDELKEMAQEKIDSYGEDGNISCESIEEQDGMVKVRLSYKNADDYAGFNGRTLFCGSVSEAGEAGYDLKDMVSAEDGALDDEQFNELADHHAIVIQTGEETLGVNVYGKILYTSPDAEITNKKTAVINSSETDAISCIIFK